MTRKQLLVYHSQAQIALKYHELRLHRTKAWKESVDLEMAKEWMNKSNEYNLEIAKKEQRLFELLGLVKIFFPSTTDLNEKIDRIYKVKYFGFSPPSKEMNLEQIQEWKDKAMLQAQNLAEQEYGKPLEDLMNYLTSYVRP